MCEYCDHHLRIGSSEYFDLLFDEGKFVELGEDIVSSDPLKFTDTKDYTSRIKASQDKTGLKDALRTGHGEINGIQVVICCMDFRFIGGSMGSVVGEKISQGIDHAIEHNLPVLIISKSGGARMMEGALSLMQMAKISAKLALLGQEGLPYISLLTDPTTEVLLQVLPC